MNTPLVSGLLLPAALFFTLRMVSPAQPAPKRILVVTVTEAFRHSSIPVAEKVLGELGRKSGLFTVEYARVEPGEPQFKGEDGKTNKTKVDAAIKAVLAEKMNPEALKNYDAVVFAHTTGELPLPDKQAFLDWLKSGKGFVGVHSATDTFHQFQPYLDMVGAEFKGHPPGFYDVDVLNQDSACPACQPLGQDWKITDEIYLFKDFDPAKVHRLLSLDKHPKDKTPGDYPVAWCKEYGKGRVFYTSLGHREDMWDPNWTKDRRNSKEIAEAYQRHLLEGIKWALGLEKWDAKPQQSAPK
jgi:type 1 glutamine amidotransferase